MSAARFEHHIKVTEAGARAVDLLAEASELSKQRIKKVMQKGAVWISRGGSTRRLRRAGKSLRQDDRLHLYYDEAVIDNEPEAAHMVADEGAYSVWYKPCGMLCQGSKWGDHCTINRWVEQNLRPQRPSFIVHRLDRAATGLIILAHQKKMAAALAELFERRAIEKRYRVCVEGHFVMQNSPLLIDADIDDRPASTTVRLLDYDPACDRSMLDVKIDTGRKHQIRKHLSGLGFPVVGDRLYGNGSEDSVDDLQLTACFLSFRCPLSGETKTYKI